MKKIQKGMLLLIFIALFSSCSHYHYVESNLYFTNLTGKGQHIVTLSVNSSNTQGESLTSVQSKIVPIIDASKPLAEMTITSSIEGNVLYVSMTYPFSSLADFETKAELITGNDYTFTKTEGSDIFVKDVEFSGLDLDEEDFSRWAVQAIDDANLFDYDNLVSRTSGQGSTIYFDGNNVDDYYGDFVLYNVWNIENLVIENTLSKNLNITRKIIFTLDLNSAISEQVSMINDDTVLNFFQSKIDSTTQNETLKNVKVVKKVNQADGKVDYVISFSSIDPSSISNMTTLLIQGFNDSVSVSVNETTNLVDWSEAYYGSGPESYMRALVNPIKYVLKLNDYKIKTVGSEEYIQGAEYSFTLENSKLMYTGNSAELILGLKYDSTREMLMMGAAALAVLGLLALIRFFYYKKNPEKLAAAKAKKALSKEQAALKAKEAVSHVVTKSSDDQYQIISIADGKIEIKKQSEENSLFIPLENAYDAANINDTVAYFTDGHDHFIQKL